MTAFRLKPLALLLCAPVLASTVWADTYPNKPITLTVGYGAGGGTDVCNRVLAQDVGKQLGQSVVVDNKPGAGSSLSVSYAIRQRPDGYSIASLSTGALLNQVLTPSIKYDVTKDITPIAMVAQYQVGVLVRADSPYKTMADLIKASQASSKPLSSRRRQSTACSFCQRVWLANRAKTARASTAKAARPKTMTAGEAAASLPNTPVRPNIRAPICKAPRAVRGVIAILDSEPNGVH